jgi:hypothetical protein
MDEAQTLSVLKKILAFVVSLLSSTLVLFLGSNCPLQCYGLSAVALQRSLPYDVAVFLGNISFLLDNLGDKTPEGLEEYNGITFPLSRVQVQDFLLVFGCIFYSYQVTVGPNCENLNQKKVLSSEN